MPAITIINEPNRTLVYQPDAGVVHHTILGKLSSAEFRDLLTRGAECLEKNKATKWLSDDRKNGPISPDDATWGETVWGTRVLKAGFKFWAIVVPAHAVGSLQMRRFANEYRDRGVAVEVFAELEPALKWLAP